MLLLFRHVFTHVRHVTAHRFASVRYYVLIFAARSWWEYKLTLEVLCVFTHNVLLLCSILHNMHIASCAQ